jgi:DNA-binding transcriptional ArsR family regulator
MARFDADAALRAIAHPDRRQMLRLVSNVEQTSSDLAKRCKLTRPATSQHLKVLRDAELVHVRRDGNRRFYRLREDRLAEVLAMLDSFWGERLERMRADLARRRGRT